MPHLALADSSTAREWVTDAAAAATAIATGIKSRNGVVSQSASAVRDVRDGDTLKTILEYAEERGLSTGIISNDDRTGVTIAAVSAFYAHTNNRQRSADIFQQLLNPKFGNGPDVVIGTGLKWISAETAKAGRNLSSDIASKGYAYVIGSGVDAAAYDPDSHTVFFSDGDGTLNAFRQKSADQYEDLGAVVTQPGAKTLVLDPKTKRIFLPGADTEMVPAADPSQKPQKKVTPNTFGVLVVRPVQSL